MQERKCSKCGSVNVYKSTRDSWHQDGVFLQVTAVDSFPALFKTEAFICLDCRNLEIQVLETSTIYGTQKGLAETVQSSSNWRKA